MNTEILGVVAQIVLLVVLSYPLGKYIANVYKGKKTCLDRNGYLSFLRYQPRRGDELETILACIINREPLLVHLGYAFVGASRLSSVKPGWKRRTDSPSGIQYLYFIHGEL
jgi:K+-transporting ATPase A subunit